MSLLIVKMRGMRSEKRNFGCPFLGGLFKFIKAHKINSFWFKPSNIQNRAPLAPSPSRPEHQQFDEFDGKALI